MTIGVGIFVHDDESMFTTMQNQTRGIFIMTITNTENTSGLCCFIIPLDIGHAPGAQSCFILDPFIEDVGQKGSCRSPCHH